MARMKQRAAAAVALASPPVAAAMVTIAGAETPAYDPAALTISRLAVPGMPHALLVQAAICVAAAGCLALALRVPQVRRFLVIAGAGLLVTALIRLDPASAPATAAHRIASAVAVAGLVAAPLLYGRISLVVAVAEVTVLIVGLGLLTTSFSEWGLWERCLLALPLAWMMLVAAGILGPKQRTNVSSADSPSPAAGSVSITGL